MPTISPEKERETGADKTSRPRRKRPVKNPYQKDTTVDMREYRNRLRAERLATRMKARE